MMRKITYSLTVCLMTGCFGEPSPLITSNEVTENSEMTEGSSSGEDGESTSEDLSSTTNSPQGEESGESSSSTGEPPTLEAPGPQDPCDPLLSGMEDYACVSPDGSLFEYGCTPVVVDKGPAPDFLDIWGYRCAIVQDTYEDGFQVGNFCSGVEWDTMNTWGTGCMNSLCLQKFSLPQDVNSGQKILPDSLCGVFDFNDPGLTWCCTNYCELNVPNACGTGMKCLAHGAMSVSEYVEEGAPLLGACVSETFDPSQP